jgi:glycosyltransferase involved in cell wall biosynthesis
MNTPLVSIALCTYNGEKYLEEQLLSLVSQSYANIEIIAVDDCSSDRTYSILKKYEEKYKIKIYQNEKNLGFVKNFEKAIGLCNGDYIALADQDDVWDLHKIEILMKHIKDHVLIYHDSELINSSGTSKGKTMLDLMNFVKGSNPLNFLFYNCISGHSVLFKRDLLNYFFPVPNFLFHDMWLGFVASSLGSITYVEQCLVKYRQHEETKTDLLKEKNSTNVPSKREERIQMYRDLLEKIRLFKEYPYARSQDRETFHLLEKAYLKKKSSLFVFPLFLLLIKHFGSLYAITKKSTGSKLIHIFQDSLGLKTKGLS